MTRGANDPIVANAIISGEVDFTRRIAVATSAADVLQPIEGHANNVVRPPLEPFRTNLRAMHARSSRAEEPRD